MRGESDGKVGTEAPADAGHQDVHLRLPVTETDPRARYSAHGASWVAACAKRAPRRWWRYLPRRRRWTRVLRSSLRCFFLAIRLRRFLTTEPIRLSPRACVTDRPMDGSGSECLLKTPI